MVQYCSWFIVYSFIGWVYESILCSVIEKKWINRGFLNGPYCPIYGFGALLDIIFLGRFSNVFEIFFFGVLLTCSLEYLTSFCMEKLFHARWWDYSDKKFNINGRVCLAGAVVFGTFSVLLIKVVHPLVIKLIGKIPYMAVSVFVIAFLLGYIVDNIITFLAVAKFDEKLEELKKVLEEKRESAVRRVSSYKEEAIERIKAHVPESFLYKVFTETLSKQHKRIIKAFPKLKSIKYDDVLSEIKNFIYSKKK